MFRLVAPAFCASRRRIDLWQFKWCVLTHKWSWHQNTVSTTEDQNWFVCLISALIIWWISHGKSDTPDQSFSEIWIRNFQFEKRLHLDVYGRATIENCLFVGDSVFINLHASQNEVKPSLNNLTSIAGFDEKSPLVISKTEFKLAK